MKKLNIANVNLTTTTFQWDETEEGKGLIPPGLAAVTETILRIHAANGDLDWVEDTIADMKRDLKKAEDRLDELTPEAIRRILSVLEDADIGVSPDEPIPGELQEQLKSLVG